MFEKAARNKLRFPFKGLCTVEDLWDMSLEQLSTLHSYLVDQAKQFDGSSLLATKTLAAKVTDEQIEIVKHVFTTLQAEKEERKTRAERLLQKKKIDGLIAEKKEDSLKAMTIEELEQLKEKL